MPISIIPPPGLRPPVRRDQLEYPTEDVSYSYLAIIGKLTVCPGDPRVTVVDDVFSDKAVENYAWVDADRFCLWARIQDNKNCYIANIRTSASTSDYQLTKLENGTESTLGSESVDLDTNKFYKLKLSCNGSTLKAYRDDMTTPKITATDTTFASGYFGFLRWATSDICAPCRLETGWLRPPSSPIPPAKAVIEVDVIGSGTEDDPYRPSLASEIVEDRDLLAVTWGAFEYKPGKSSAMVVMIYGDNPYLSGAVDRQRQSALRSFSPPTDYAGAVELYKALRVDHPEWIAGKDNFAYQVLGLEELELFAVADFYYGFLVEHRTRPQLDQLKRVPDWEMRRTLSRWIDRLSRVSVLTEERDKHLEKLRKVLKLGW